MIRNKAIPGFSTKNSVIQSLLLPVGAIFFVSVLVVGYLWTSSEFRKLDEENTRYEAEYLDNQKSILRSEVLRVKSLLLREKEKAEAQLQDTLKGQIDFAHQIASSVYQHSLGKYTDDTIQQMILSSLQDVEINENGYFFISTLDGDMLLYPPDLSLNGEHVGLVFPDSGQDILLEIRDLAKDQKQGFIRYMWPKDGKRGEAAVKFSYVKLFEPYGWVIGTGAYLNDFEEKIKQQIFQQISEITYGTDNEGYFFINSYDGDLYVTNGKYFGGEKNIWDVQDARGTKVVQANARIAQENPEGGFSTYFWQKNSGEVEEKLSYVLGMDEWQIFIGTGAYLDTVRNELSRRELTLADQVKKRIYSAVVVLGAALLIVLAAMWLIGKRLAGNMRLIRHSFEESVSSRQHIDVEEVYFDEFRALAHSANNMIDGLNQQADELQHRVLHDHLTSLPNRLQGASHLNSMIERSIHSQSMVGLLFIDLDNFKEINDSLGHSAGDELLQKVSLRLQSVVREDDIVARLGGDEFTVITGLLSVRSDAAVIADKLLAAFRQPFTVENTELHITASIGISLFPDDGDDAEILLRNADSAMYEAKRDGRNGFRFYTPDMTVEVRQRVLMTDELREAIDKGQFLLHFQPQLCLSTGEVIGAEALVRWKHPERGMVPPGEFIPYAESSGQIAQIGEWVLREACAKMAEWHAQGYSLRKVAVNISNQQLRRRSLVTLVKSALKDTGCEPDALELEITESTLMQNPEEMVEELVQLKALGISLAIDDFGTGYSSLSYLKQLPINKLKIDRSFVRDIDVDENDRAITRAIVALGKSLNLTVIAEGVEYASQISFLANEECEQIQGFFYSKPLPEAEFLEYLNTHKSRREEMAEWI
ncbi:EAL domain-containing protein [Pontibacterium sp.]|uniref:bifunctional diguanylate cyclase/phosphodiesterase n=1 Tax=Pontibacterium sp. TaxID=2036026 RepID=UPI0035144E24